MEIREDYEHQELDTDYSYYWFMNSDIQSPYKNPKLKDILTYWRDNEVNNGVYYKGTRLYFTFEGVKYYLSWTFYDKAFIDTAIKLLRTKGAENIQINYGELD